MNIVLTFDEIPEGVNKALVDIWIEDQSEADRPAPRVFSKQLNLVSIQPLGPTVLEIDPGPLPENKGQLSVVVRVKSQNTQPVEYLNTTTTPLPNSSSESVTVALSRIQ